MQRRQLDDGKGQRPKTYIYKFFGRGKQETGSGRVGSGHVSVCQTRCLTRFWVLRAYFHYGCALRCVALRGDWRERETPRQYFYFSRHATPRNATRSRNGNKP